MVAVSLLLLLLFNLSLGQEDPPAVEVIGEGLNPCHCETRTFNEDEMTGTLKFFHNLNCTSSCTYEYFIKPRSGYIVSLEDKDIRTDSQRLSTFYYTGESRETEMVPMGFERIPVTELKKTCPQPIFNVTSKAQNIGADWPKRGCTLRLQAEYPIIVRGDISLFRLAKLTFLRNRIKAETGAQIAPAIKADGSLDLDINQGYILYTVQPKTDLLYRPVIGGEEPKNLTVVSLDYDPCNCSTREINIEAGQTVNLEVDHKTTQFCSMLSCSVLLNLTKKADEDQMNSFVIETSRDLPSTTEVSLKIDDQLVELDKWLGQSHMNILTGERLKIAYRIYAPSRDHSFSMNITALSQPHDCRCTSNGHKYFFEKEGSFEMTIPPHCTHMMCHYLIHIPLQHYTILNQILHIDADYKFHNEILHIAGEHELMLHSASRRENFVGDLLSNNSKVLVTYFRKGVHQGLNETSQFKIDWHWATLHECSCGKTSLTAFSKWSAIYSPRYPQEYCTNLTCHYNVEAPERHHLKFVVSQFETEPHRDILSIFEGNKTLLQLSGHQPNYTMNVDTEGQKAMVTFHSDDTVTAKGFKLSYIAVPDVDYIPEALTEGYPQGFVIAGAILLFAFLIAACIFLAYKRKVFQRSISPAYSFLPKSDEVVVIDAVDKE